MEDNDGQKTGSPKVYKESTENTAVNKRSLSDQYFDQEIRQKLLETR